MSAFPPVPVTLVIARSYPLDPGQTGPVLEVPRQLNLRGERTEVIAESPDEEEFIQLDPQGALVHRVCPQRAYTRRFARPLLRHRQMAFAIRALEKAHELRLLWNRAIVRVEVAGDPSEALLFGALPLRPESASAPPVRWPLCRSVSLVCATYNRVHELVASIESFLAAQAEAKRDGIECELVVVFQNDKTPERVLAERPDWASAPLRWVRSEPGLPRARNTGIRESHGDLIVFVDDDVLLDPGFVRGHLDAANAHSTSAGNAGRVRSRILGERGSMNRAIGQLRLSAFVDTHFDSLTKTQIAPHTPIGANMAFKRQALSALLGEAWFDERLGGSAHREETTLCVELFRRGGHLVFARDASLLHLEAESGGCDNRGAISARKEIDHLALDYLFFRRFFRDLGPMAPLAPLAFLARDVRISQQATLQRAYLNARGYFEGLALFRRYE